MGKVRKIFQTKHLLTENNKYIYWIHWKTHTLHLVSRHSSFAPRSLHQPKSLSINCCYDSKCRGNSCLNLISIIKNTSKHTYWLVGWLDDLLTVWPNIIQYIFNVQCLTRKKYWILKIAWNDKWIRFRLVYKTSFSVFPVMLNVKCKIISVWFFFFWCTKGIVPNVHEKVHK